MTRQVTILTTFLLTMFSCIAYSQTTDTLKAKRIIITTSLTDYLPTLKLNTINFNIGTECYLRNRKTLHCNIGLITSYGQASGWFSISSQSTQGFKVQVGGRHYLNKHKIFEPAISLFWPHILQYKSQTLQNTGYYVAVNSFYQWTTTDRQEIVLNNIDNNPFPNSAHYKENIYTVDRNAIGLSVLLGYQCVKKSGLTVDYSIGFGGQFVSSHSTNRIGTDTNWPNSEKEYPNKLFDSGTALVPNIIYQVRLGWAL